MSITDPQRQLIDVGSLTAAQAVKVRHTRALSGGGTDIDDLTWTLRHQDRPIELIPRRLVKHRETFESGIANWTQLNRPDGSTVAVTYSKGKAIFTGGADGGCAAFKFNCPLGIPSVASMVRIEAWATGSGGGVVAAIVVGAVKDANNYIGSLCNLTANEVSTLKDVAGSIAVQDTVSHTWPATLNPFNFAGSINVRAENAWSDEAGVPGAPHWVALQKSDSGAFDFTTAANLKDFSHGFVMYLQSGGMITLSLFECGAFGHTGRADWKAVTMNGEPYRVGNKQYLTFSRATTDRDATAEHTLRQFGFGVAELDLKTHQIETTAVIYASRSTNVVPYLNGNIDIDSSTGLSHVWWTPWSDDFTAAKIEIHHTSSYDDLLNGIHIIPSGTIVTLPTTTSSYDAHGIKRANGKWWLAYTATSANTTPWTFYPVLAEATDPDGTYTLLDSKPAVTDGEGTNLFKWNGVEYLACTGSAYRAYPLDSAGVFGTPLTLTLPVLGSTQLSHPCIIPVQDGSGTRAVAVLHDNAKYATITWLHGTAFVLASIESLTGWEFPLAKSVR